ncbi:MAG: 2-octaprenyl-6-methoxyphenyl hydroxylase, partial [Endozoicomonas sp.]
MMSPCFDEVASMDFDVLVIGAGLVGASLVCGLESSIRQQGLRLALVETHDLDSIRERPPSFDARASALSWGTRCIYDELGLWQKLSSEACAIEQVHVSDRGHFGVTRLSARDEGVEALGYVVKNHCLGDALLERIKEYRQQGMIQLFSPDQVESLKPIPGGMEARLSSASIRASLVVLVDGGRSGLMDQLGIARDVTEYQQHGVIANIALDRPHQGVAYERFAGKGPMALLPLKPGSGPSSFQHSLQHRLPHQSALVWTVPDCEMDEVLSMDDRSFLATLQARFGYRAGRFLAVGKWDHYPLSMSLAKEQVRPGLVILGNAAHAIHPVAGQGYNLAIRDTKVLANSIRTSVDKGVCPGDLLLLLSYQQEQQKDQWVTSRFCDGLVKLFSKTDAVSVLARNLGLTAMDRCPPVKSRFARK